MTEQKSKPSGFVRFLRGLLRLILALLLGILIGLAIFFGLKYAYQEIVIPTQQNSMEITDLKYKVGQQAELALGKNLEFEERISNLETNQKTLDSQISELQAGLDQFSANLDAYSLQQENITERLNKMDQLAKNIESQIADLSTQTADTQAQLKSMDVDDKIEPVYQNLEIFRILLQINRSRLYLFQDNYGSAKQELDLARQMFVDLQPYVNENQLDQFSLWKARMDLAISHLPDNPILANDDLEILWTMMADGFSETTSLPDQATSTQQAETNESTTATPTPTPKP